MTKEPRTRLNVHIAELGHNSTVELDGVDISHKIDGITIHSYVGEASRVTISYVAVEADVESDNIETVSLRPPKETDGQLD
jgi:hypothetical protein